MFPFKNIKWRKGPSMKYVGTKGEGGLDLNVYIVRELAWILQPFGSKFLQGE